MHDMQMELEEFNRYAFEGEGFDNRGASSALREAISKSRHEIESAFQKGISTERLGKIKVRVKAHI